MCDPSSCVSHPQCGGRLKKKKRGKEAREQEEEEGEEGEQEKKSTNEHESNYK